MGKSVIITGAGSGLGRALARKLAAEGHSLLLLGRTVAKLEAVVAELGASATAIECDVGCPDSVRSAFAKIGEHHPQIDVLISNAGVFQPFLVKDATDKQINDALMTNLAGPVYCARAVIPMMRRGSQIITISSETVTMRHAMFSLYQSTKAGLERFTEALHEELAADGIRVTMVRAGQMSDADSKPAASPEVARAFVEENLKRGLDLRTRPTSAFDTVANTMASLLSLPTDVHVPQIILEGYKA
ncbi:MAG TPA: SDR family oxidoreductase [Sphingobium sp.]|uniref:SDR family oxidoreductase n=1 Tax=Sphingobium sp. TaxID=1912891 RepID=UPI002ED3861C